MKNIEIEIKKLGINGEGIGYYENTVVFIPNTLPSEVVEVEELEKFKGYYKAKAKTIIKKSEDRVKPKCPIFDRCQVCSIMPLKYEKQIEAKQQHLIESIRKYTHYKVHINNTIEAENPFNYRNTIKLPLFNLREQLAIGIHFRDTNHYVYLKDCVVQDEQLNKTLDNVLSILDNYRYRAYDRKTKLGIRYLMVRSFGDEVLITFVTGKNTRIIDEAIEEISQLKNVKSINQTTNTKSSNEIIVEPIKNIYGKKSINVPFNGLNYKLSPESFMQLNIDQAIKMYDVIKDYLGTGNGTVLDLYCGVGSITNYVSECADRIIGIEISKPAIKDAKENAKMNRIKNTEFVSGDV
ncbi:MAG: 23S rRNA (uracil(1939)-C(5))-methyltransferase RlmD, partial [Erysipelotrichales bacterium]